MSQAVIILQARMGSTRLPGKVLEPIGARSLLGHCLARLRLGSAAPVMLATTTSPLDDVLVRAASPYGIPVFRGPEDDVLSRYVQAARSMGVRCVASWRCAMNCHAHRISSRLARFTSCTGSIATHFS